jgi:hypothetical protein
VGKERDRIEERLFARAAASLVLRSHTWHMQQHFTIKPINAVNPDRKQGRHWLKVVTVGVTQHMALVKYNQ